VTEINIEHIEHHDQESDELFVTTDRGNFSTAVKKGLSMMYMINIITCILEETSIDYSKAVVIFNGEVIEAMETV
jgi:hypothetical protein